MAGGVDHFGIKQMLAALFAERLLAKSSARKGDGVRVGFKDFEGLMWRFVG